MEFLGQRNIVVVERLEARKNRIDSRQAWEKIGNAACIEVAKGKKVIGFSSPAEKDAVLQQVIGPSGNLRAPTLELGDRFIVGFNLELYQRIFSGN